MEFQPHAFINWLIRCLFSIKRNLHFSGQQSWPAFPYFLFGTENITPLETVVIKILVFGAFIHSLFSKNVQWCTEGMAGEKEGSSYETTPGAAQSAWDNAKGWRGWRGVQRIRNYFVKHKISSYLIYYIFEYVQETGSSTRRENIIASGSLGKVHKYTLVCLVVQAHAHCIKNQIYFTRSKSQHLETQLWTNQRKEGMQSTKTTLQMPIFLWNHKEYLKKLGMKLQGQQELLQCNGSRRHRRNSEWKRERRARTRKEDI